MDDGTVTANVFGDGICEIEFFHPKANALPLCILQGLRDEITRAGKDPAVRVIVLKSQGDKSFCGGASFEEFSRIATLEQGEEFFLGFAEVILAIKDCPCFVVARVHGKVVGGGLGLVAASDYAFATSAASARLSEFALGIGPFTIGPVVARKIGLAAFQAMSIDAGWRTAEDLHRWGFYAQVFNDTPTMDAILTTFVTELSTRTVAATQALKRMFWADTESYPELLRSRARVSANLLLAQK